MTPPLAMPAAAPALFADLPAPRQAPPPALLPTMRQGLRPGIVRSAFSPEPDDTLLEVMRRVDDPTDPRAIRDLYLSFVETHEPAPDKALSAAWLASRPLRQIDTEMVLSSTAIVAFVKQLFNTFFRDDLYGRRRNADTLMLSSGSVHEEIFGLTSVGKAAVHYALARDWYGYSDSRGRVNARAAIAELENERLGHRAYGPDNVALTMGATQAIASLADMLLGGKPWSGTRTEALCAIPNYPPLVQALARHAPVKLVPLPCAEGATRVDPLLTALRPDTPLVLLQTVINPTGAVVDEIELERLIEAASPNTMILLDESHEFLAVRPLHRTPARARSNVIRISSLSKVWSTPGMKIGWIVAETAVIDRFYEIASTGYGGPPSLFFTLVEVIARFERWDGRQLAEPGQPELAEFDAAYGLTDHNLRTAYATYRLEKTTRERLLSDHRATFTAGLRQAGFDVLPPAASINALAFPPGDAHSYCAFRRMMRETNIACYPAILTFCLGSNALRMTSARPWTELSEALTRIGDAAHSGT